MWLCNTVQKLNVAYCYTLTRRKQGCELDQFLIEFEFKRHLQVQARVVRILFFEFKFEFGKNDRVRVQVRVRSPGLYRSQLNGMNK